MSRAELNSCFEGVCVTTVILAPGACGLGLRAALLATTSPESVAAAGVFQKAPISCYSSYLRARGLSKIDRNPSPGPSPAKGRLQGSLGELGEGLEELRESLWDLWEGAGGMKFGRFELQNCESGV